MSKKYFSSKLAKLIITVAVCGLLIFLNPKNIFSPVRNFFMTVAYPFEKIFYVMSRKLENSIEFIGSISRLRSENEKLLKENISLTSKVSVLNQEKNENDLLRKQLNLLPKKKFDLEGCYVIGQDPQKMGNWVIIDKGQSSGIEAGMPVIVSNSILIGRVGEVYFNSSRVDLLTNSSSSINVVDSDTGSKGIVRGEFGLGVILDMVAQADVINEGDEVVTSGLGSDMPKGLLVGRIQDARMTGDKLFQQALIISPIKYSALEAVFVIKNSK